MNEQLAEKLREMDIYSRSSFLIGWISAIAKSDRKSTERIKEINEAISTYDCVNKERK